MRLSLTDIVHLGDTRDLRLATLDAMSVAGLKQRRWRLPVVFESFAQNWLTFAERNRVAPIVAHKLMDQLGGSPRKAWRSIHDQSRNRMTALLGTLDEVADRFADESIRLVALKNGGIARGTYLRSLLSDG